jgi:probable phosphoglycerate mutase
MRLYLVRHAEPTLAGRFIGTTDPPLSERGHAAAEEKMRTFAVDHAFVSPRQRARQTAAYLEAPQTVLDGLGEIDFGQWEGLSWGEIINLDPANAQRKMKDWFGCPAPGGEAWKPFSHRVQRALDTIRESQHACVAVVAHLLVNAAIHQAITGQPPDSFKQEYLDAAEYHL